MRLYRFMNSDNALRSIRERRIRIGRLEELNDDFELLGIALEGKRQRIALRETRRRLSESSGVICMSKGWSSPLMWAHYADSHKGVALGFDVPDENFLKVEYVSERPTLASMGLSGVEEINEVTMKRLIRLKAKGWEYEEEYRAFAGLTDGVRINGQLHYFLEFGLQFVLREVIVGSRFQTERKEVKAAIAGLDNVETFMVRGDFTEFKIVRQHQDSVWQ